MDRFENRYERDDDAHVIHKPGRRLLHGIPLRFVWNKVSGHGQRSVSAGLNLVSFIDFLIVTVIFLIMQFSASGEITTDKSITLPKAENVEDMLEAPVVVVNGTQILVNGQIAGTTRELAESGQVTKIQELFDILKAQRENWKTLKGDASPFPGVAILQVDGGVPAVVVKSVFQTTASAGYPNVSFMVNKLAESGAAAAP
jgi:biopolymer transport protein ExbD